MTEQQPTNHQYSSKSRGYKTKGNTYKDRYVEKECPECGHMKAYKDEWRTRVAYSCMKRSCRNKWYEAITPVQTEMEETIEPMAEALTK